MIRTSRQHAESLRQRSEWINLKRVTLKTARGMSIREEELTAFFDGHIEKLEKELAVYQNAISQIELSDVDIIGHAEIISQSLLRMRVSLNISQTELAKRVGVCRQQINRYEKDGYREISLARAVAIAEVFEQSVQRRGKLHQELLGDDEYALGE
jgi:DNA-binding XRE family transcriptional regulator